jgi:hypothetical protein
LTIPYFARLHFGEGHLELTTAGRWEPSTPDLQASADEANALSRPPSYTYSPSHGKFGFRLARMVGERLGADSVEITPQPDGPPGRIY